MKIKNKRYVLICTILHTIILIIFFRMANSSGKIIYNSGLLRDELSITGSEPVIIGDGLWATFIISYIFCILSFAMLWWTIRSAKKLVVFCIFAVIFLFFGKYVVDVSSNYYHNIEDHKSSISRIDLKRLEEFSDYL